MHNSVPHVYAITDSTLLPGTALQRKVEAVLAEGCGWVQYRDKSADYSRRQHEAAQLLELCQSYCAKLIINDDIALAAAVGAHGVHLGQEDADASVARAQLGPDAIIGITCHANLALAVAAQAAGASYVAFGRFYSSATKPGARAAPLTILTKARRELELPIVAIGGINLNNATDILRAGASTLAVCASLFDCDDPGARARAFRQLASSQRAG